MAFRIEDLILPGVLAGGLLAFALYKDQIIAEIDKLLKSVGGGTNGGDGGGDGNGTTPKPKPEPKPEPVPTTGGQWYKANGPTAKLPAGRQDGQSNRWNHNVTGWSNGFEVMGYLSVTGMTGGSHIGLKMAGPNHSGNCGYKLGGSCCCWWDGGLRRNGASYLEIERPHPHNLKTKMFTSMGRNIDAGVLGVRWYNAKEGSGRRVMFWVDTSGKANAHKWRLLYNVLDTGQFMPTDYYNKIPGTIELEIRISDVPANKIKWLTGPIGRKIGTASNYAHALYTNYVDEGLDRITAW